jgi:hypothetical protein
LSVLFTVLYICKRSSNKRMTKKAKLQRGTQHHPFGTEKRGGRRRKRFKRAAAAHKGSLHKNAWQQQDRAPRNCYGLRSLSLPPCRLAERSLCFGDWAACRSRHTRTLHYCAMMVPFLAHTPTHLISIYRPSLSLSVSLSRL